MSWPYTKRCPKCGGSGRRKNLLWPGSHLCQRCGGRGEVETWAHRAYARWRYGPESASGIWQEEA
jgi:DnaJ-class molecular chaperone